MLLSQNLLIQIIVNCWKCEKKSVTYFYNNKLIKKRKKQKKRKEKNKKSMKEIKVVRIQKCGFCSDLVKKIKQEGLVFQELDANENEELAEKLEDYLDTLFYPMVIISSEHETTYLYRPREIKEVGHTVINTNPYAKKIGCVTIDSFLTQLKLNK